MASCAGRSTLAQAATQALIQTMAQPAQAGEALSAREREVLVSMVSGSQAFNDARISGESRVLDKGSTIIEVLDHTALPPLLRTISFRCAHRFPAVAP